MAALGARSRDPQGRGPRPRRAAEPRVGGAGAVTGRAGIALAVLQFAFALTWVVYAAFLPALAAQVGVAKELVPWILVADQAIFLICDWLAGVFADRIGDAAGR